MNLVFFTDRDLGTRFPEILASAGLKVERHRDHFPHDCADEDWLRIIGRRGWVAVSHDRRIRYKPNELANPDAPGTVTLWYPKPGKAWDR
ncbi:MAG: hypothetical protein ACREXS_18510 [Gammaproteobacteria bacterium]